jgi:predicted DNA-binding transcriptional regulator YafY
MRPADRLFQLVQLIRGRRLCTATFLAERLEVSPRTVYRDIAQLQRQGVPIEGEAGMGYRLGKGFDLPPLMFTENEAAAMVASVRLAQALLDAPSALAAESALGKILSVLPVASRAAAEQSPLFAPSFHIDPQVQATLASLRLAIQNRRKVSLDYRNAEGQASQRVLRPLGCFYWGKVWTLGAWCESRQAFRSFRLDRIEQLVVLDQAFALESGKSLSDFLRYMGEH